MSNKSISSGTPQKLVLRIGCAAGFSGDRVDAAIKVVDSLIALGGPSFLIFETLAERTLALAQLRRKVDSEEGYELLLDEMLQPVLARCLEHGIRIVSNFGAANPVAAAKRIQYLAREQGLPPPRIAVIWGDDVSHELHRAALRQQIGERLDSLQIVSANAYIGAEAIADALDAGAQIVVAGRVADPSLALGPALSHFQWSRDDWNRLGAATMAGHLLECGAQVCGGYFADPGYKDVPDLHILGYPIATLFEDGNCCITKAPETGGLVSTATVKEQLLYEIHDPSAYLTPDVVADISQAEVVQLGPNQVELTGVQGHARPNSLKVNICYEAGWLAEGEISYAGSRAEGRARLAAEILRQRLPALNLRVDLIGVLSVFADDHGRLQAKTAPTDARDVRLRIAASHPDKVQAEQLCREVTALYTCGPAGGGGVRTALTARLDTLSCTMPRELVPTGFVFVEDLT